MRWVDDLLSTLPFWKGPFVGGCINDRKSLIHLELGQLESAHLATPQLDVVPDISTTWMSDERLGSVGYDPNISHL